MYSGPGSTSMLTAAAAWEALAAGLESTARAYCVVISQLQGESWSGSASAAMGSAVAPYLAWATATGAQAEQAASGARAAAAAYEAAFAATVPPALVIANRDQLATLMVTNVFGQNTTAIAATESEYEQMWAQDAAAMYGYAAASSAATRLTPFREPPQTANVTGQTAQSIAVAQAGAASAAGNARTGLTQLMSTVSQELQALAAGGHPAHSWWLGHRRCLRPSAPSTHWPAGEFGLEFQPYQYVGRKFPDGAYRSGIQAGGGAAKAIAKGAESVGPATLRGQVTVSVGNAAPVGRLSVPQGWATANPPVLAAADEPMWLSDNELDGGPSWSSETPEMLTGPPTAGMGPIAGFSTRPTVGSVLRVEPRRFKMPRPSLGG
ncbi:PPE family protein [Mycobacterium kansasii]|uniref:PPE family protein n=1 Tax=Mycobacterium kansasii TaxID=1768 RepID=A0A1V3XG07_MYCKA|nr:PPE family protein [Mycobacterium kansasii]